jgi:carbon-monoxide dehydrogenase medium subunit
MKPAPFRYESPTALPDVHALLLEHGDEAKVLAGGQSLGPLLNLRMSTPSVLIDLARVPELSGGLGMSSGGLRIAAMTTYRDVLDDPRAASLAPLLVEAIPFVGHATIRNSGTIGGSVAHADPAGEMPACVVALGATINVRSADGARAVPADEFFTGTFGTIMEEGEVLASIDVPGAPGQGSAWLEVAPRHGDYAVVGVGVVVSLAEGRMVAVRVCLSGVADRPLLVDSEPLVGRVHDEAEVAAFARGLAADLRLQGDLIASAAYKRHLVRMLTARAVSTAVGRAATAGAVVAG